MLENSKSRKIFLFILFFLATSFFVFQHSRYLGWDFAAYVLNAKYLFSGGDYFEWGRSPLMPFLIGIFSLVSFGNYLVAEYLYIVFVSFLLFFSSLFLAKKAGLDSLIFYGVLLSPFLLLSGLAEGTELLSLALITLALGFLLSEKRKDFFLAGIFMGLAFLAHYRNIIFLALLFIKRPEAKKFFLSIFAFVLVISPWFLYNFFASSSFLTSIVDSYAQNIYFRWHLFEKFSLSHLMKAFNYYYLIFFSLGIFLFLKKSRDKKNVLIIEVLMLVIFVLVLFFYSRIPLKNIRYLFLLVLPISYFSYVFFTSLNKKTATIIFVSLVIINFLSSFFIFSFFYDNNRKLYEEVATRLDKKCVHASDMWVFLSYFGIPTEQMPWNEEEFLSELKKGKKFIIFGSFEPPYISNKTFLKNFPHIFETSFYVIIGEENSCLGKYKINKSYLATIREKNLT
ncbi:MAG: hypothetical protein NZ889_02115, partial [Candidatus Pacearchaeota archaeon]|nr:hypothetical protein [Candidatus Pacearchaeota archaeon]